MGRITSMILGTLWVLSKNDILSVNQKTELDKILGEIEIGASTMKNVSQNKTMCGPPPRVQQHPNPVVIPVVPEPGTKGNGAVKIILNPIILMVLASYYHLIET